MSKFSEALTYDDVQKHNNAESLWCIVKVRFATLSRRCGTRVLSLTLVRDLQRNRDKPTTSLISLLSILVSYIARPLCWLSRGRRTIPLTDSAFPWVDDLQEA